MKPLPKFQCRALCLVASSLYPELLIPYDAPRVRHYLKSRTHTRRASRNWGLLTTDPKAMMKGIPWIAAHAVAIGFLGISDRNIREVMALTENLLLLPEFAKFGEDQEVSVYTLTREDVGQESPAWVPRFAGNKLSYDGPWFASLKKDALKIIYRHAALWGRDYPEIDDKPTFRLTFAIPAAEAITALTRISCDNLSFPAPTWRAMPAADPDPEFS